MLYLTFARYIKKNPIFGVKLPIGHDWQVIIIDRMYIDSSIT